MVVRKLHHYSQSSMVTREVPKLVAKYYGSYKVVDKIGNSAYKLKLTSTWAIHPTLHVSQLKAALTSE